MLLQLVLCEVVFWSVTCALGLELTSHALLIPLYRYYFYTVYVTSTLPSADLSVSVDCACTHSSPAGGHTSHHHGRTDPVGKHHLVLLCALRSAANVEVLFLTEADGSKLFEYS